MQNFARILAIVFLALFAASSTVHVVSANSMALDMAFGDVDGMPDCQGCAADKSDVGDLGSCDMDCTAPGIATIDAAPEPLFAMLPPRQERLQGVSLPSGRSGVPDPFPPRFLI